MSENNDKTGNSVDKYVLDKEVQEYRDFLIALRNALTGNRYELTAKAIDNFLARQRDADEQR